MSNYEKYHFNDFVLANYKRLLSLALEKYEFIGFADDIPENKKTIILRHDVEFSLERAYKMALIEAELGIKSIYLVQVHSEFYSIFEKESYLYIRKIQDLGHEIGLHFDSDFYNVTALKEELGKLLLEDKKIIEAYLETPIRVFSFHNTNPAVLSCNEKEYAGMLNVYSDYFKSKFAYQSDSTGIWRYERLEDRLLLAEEPRLQILIHDGMWQDEPMSPRKRVFKCIDERAQKVKELYDKILIQFRQSNIDDN